MAAPMVLALTALAAGGASPATPPDPPTAALEPRPALERVTAARINRVRRAAGLPPVRVSSALRRSAARHGRWLVRTGLFQHEGPGGAPFWARLRPIHPRGPHGEVIAENAACRTADTKLVLRAWMTSPPHRRVLLHRRFRWVGVSVQSRSRCGFGTYVADFGA